MNTLNIILFSCLRIHTTFTMNAKTQQRNDKETRFSEMCTVYKLIYLYFSSRKRSITVTTWMIQIKQNSVTA